MNRLICSFSGGRTSAYMTWRVLQEWRDQYDEITVLFANTGLEHEKTLEFVNNCDKHFGFNTVWLEAVTHMEHGKGQTHKIVNFETASRNGEPFERMVAKEGIPNAGQPKCTDRLKAVPIRHYIREVLGHKRYDYKHAIGIRADEIDRMSSIAMSKGIIYPLVRWGVNKQQILDWWTAQDFDLEIDPIHGNCVTCWRKSPRKLLTIAKNNPEYFEPMIRMEERYGFSGSRAKMGDKPTVFFRGHESAKDIIAKSSEQFVQWSPEFEKHYQQIGLFSLDELDISNGCTESCEVDFV